jgi:hypothetical protein
MKNYKTKIIIVLYLIFIFDLNLFAQQDDSLKIKIQLEIKTGKVIIHYDLYGPKDLEYKVDVSLSKDKDKTFFYIPKDLSGDIGKGYFVGKDRRIEWNYSREFPLGLEDVIFEVTANVIPRPAEKITRQEVKESSNTIYWIGAGVAVVGGGLAAIILGGKKTQPNVVDLPDPPKWR